MRFLEQLLEIAGDPSGRSGKYGSRNPPPSSCQARGLFCPACLTTPRHGVEGVGASSGNFGCSRNFGGSGTPSLVKPHHPLFLFPTCYKVLQCTCAAGRSQQQTQGISCDGGKWHREPLPDLYHNQSATFWSPWQGRLPVSAYRSVKQCGSTPRFSPAELVFRPTCAQEESR